jgi:hypothetical protein
MANKAWDATDFIDTDVIPATEMIKHSQEHNTLGTTGRCATFVVAANNSAILAKAQADYVCDGTADNVEIQAAIDAVYPFGGMVLLLAGKYFISSTIHMRGGIILAGEAVGAGGITYGTWLTLSTNANCDVIDVDGGGTNQYFPQFVNLFIDGEYTNQSGAGPYAGINFKADFSDAIIRDVFIYHIKGDGIMYTDRGWMGRFTRLWIESCTRYGIYMTNGEIVLYGGTLTEHENGLYLSGDHVQFTGNNLLIRNNKKHGVAIIGTCEYVDLAHSPIHDNGTDTTNTYDGVYINLTTSNCAITISDCPKFGNDVAGLGTQRYGINFASTFKGNAMIHDNVMLDNNTAPFHFANESTFPGYDAEISGIWQMHMEYFADIRAASTTHVYADYTGIGSDEYVSSGLTNPDVPRNVSVSDLAADATGTVEIEGLSKNGAHTKETVTVVTGATAYSNGAFSSIIQLKCNIATGKHVSVGISNKLGMANRVVNESDLYKKKVNTADDTASISTNVDTDKWTLDCGTINAGDDVSVWYRSNRNVVSS